MHLIDGRAGGVTTWRAAAEERRGGALVPALTAVVLITGISGAVLTSSLSDSAERQAAVDRQRALDAATSGTTHAITSLTSGSTDNVGTWDAPVSFADGQYFVDVRDNGDDTVTLVSTGLVGRQRQTVEVVVEAVNGGVFHNAITAGNSSQDPLYDLRFGGTNSQADTINGDIYSGGDVRFVGHASATGVTRATGSVTGGPGESDASGQPMPDLGRMSYGSTADFDVNDLFSSATLAYDDAGGTAWQLPEENPAHIFRMNPGDRSEECDSTTGPDFFLEDPYEQVRTDEDWDGSDAYLVSLSGVDGAPGPDGNRAVYYIEGNLWIHNIPTYSLKLAGGAENGTQITFVVQGNIMISDNLFYDDPAMDGVALIAMVDPDVPDTGNIYFGDPRGGTIETMQAFMFAENNFHDMNLHGSGSMNVIVDGIMSAGNQVLIERDNGSQHTRLTVNHDARVRDGDLDLPGLPEALTNLITDYEKLSWRRRSESAVAADQVEEEAPTHSR